MSAKHHKRLILGTHPTHKQSTPRAGEGLPAGAARLGRAALQNHLFELQDTVVDVEGVCHDDGVRTASNAAASSELRLQMASHTTTRHQTRRPHSHTHPIRRKPKCMP